MNTSVDKLINDHQDAELAKLRAITANLQAMQPHMQALGDALPLRNQKMEDKIDEAITLSRRIATICHELKFMVPFDAELEESKRDAEGILTNFAAIRMHLANPYEPCDCGGKCDDCVAEQSDIAYDRKIDKAMR